MLLKVLPAVVVCLTNQGYERAGKTLCLENPIKTVLNLNMECHFEMRRGNALEASR